jgi:hypothetical protein
MKNNHVSSLLPDYCDGLLTPEEASEVKEHLAGCADCREELRFMKKYLKHAKSFPAVPVPGDFLEKIHARIDAPARGGIIRTLFLPLKIKLPLEAAGAFALTVLAVFIFKPFEGSRLEYHAERPEMAAPANQYRDRMAGKSTAAHERDKQSPGRTIARKDGLPSIKADDAVRRDETDRLMVTNGADTDQFAASEKKAEKEAPAADINLVLKPARSTGGAEKAKDRRHGADSAVMKTYSYSPREEAASESSRSEGLPAGNRARVGTIANTAVALDGRVVRTGDEDASGTCRLVIVEIPAKNYDRFMAGIRGAWSISSQDPSSPPKQAGRLRLYINLQD